MQNNIKPHVDTFRVVTKSNPIYQETNHPEVTFEIDGESNMHDVIDAFGRFLYAIGYNIPSGKQLGFMESD